MCLDACAEHFNVFVAVNELKNEAHFANLCLGCSLFLSRNVGKCERFSSEEPTLCFRSAFTLFPKCLYFVPEARILWLLLPVLQEFCPLECLSCVDVLSGF